MGFFSFVILAAIAYLIWRISDQMPDLLFRLSEIQRDVAELRRRTEPSSNEPTHADHSEEFPGLRAEEVRYGRAAARLRLSRWLRLVGRGNPGSDLVRRREDEYRQSTGPTASRTACPCHAAARQGRGTGH